MYDSSGKRLREGPATSESRDSESRDSESRDSEPRLQLVAFWQNESRVFDLPPQGDVRIGRAEDNEIRIEHPSVSRHHAVLRIGDELVLEDLSGSNGTFIQQAVTEPGGTAHLRQLVRKSAGIAVGQTITLGIATAVVRHASERPVSFPDRESQAKAGDEAPPSSVVVRDPELRAVYDQAERAAAANITVLIFGETGVGKELLARAIHTASPRAKAQFQSINCGALSESLLEGELFGYEKGAFTGAHQARPGLFEAANHGTVFLDEVGELSSATQVKLLRVLEERQVLRLGARSPRPIDVRFIAATNRDLETEVAMGHFRQDLFFRLNGLNLTIPPLRERPAEIEPLARAFVASACEQMERPVPLSISDEAMDALRSHAWPGNVRELRNAIDRAVILCTGPTINVDHLPAAVTQGGAARRRSSSPAAPAPAGAAQRMVSPGGPATLRSPVPEVEPERFQAEIRNLERLRIVEALKRCGGNQTRAAKLLGISRRTLVTRLGELDLPRPRKR